MTINFAKPVGTDGKDAILKTLLDNIAATVTMIGDTTPAGTPTGAVRYSRASTQFELYGGSTWAELPLQFLKTTGGSIGGHLNFTGGSRRLRVLNDFVVESPTADQATALTVAPNGTNTNASLSVANRSSGLNAGTLQIAARSDAVAVTAGKTGTGAYLPLELSAGGSVRQRIATDGRTTVLGAMSWSGTALRLQADFSSATVANRALFQAAATNQPTGVGVVPNGAATVSAWQAFNASDPTNASYISINAFAGEMQVQSAALGSGVPMPLGFYMQATRVGQITTSGTWSLTNAQASVPQLVITNPSGAGCALDLVGRAADNRSYLRAVNSAYTVQMAGMWTNISGYWFSDASFLPGADGGYSLGNPSWRWSAVYAVTGTIQTSDQRLKTDIEPCDLGLSFIDALKPRRHKWIVGSLDRIDLGLEEPSFAPRAGERIHYGFIAQEVKAVLDQVGLGDRYAGWVLADPTDPESQQGLNYAYLIAPLTRALQDLHAKHQALERTVSALAERLTILESI
jgi:hypothetical protein